MHVSRVVPSPLRAAVLPGTRFLRLRPAVARAYRPCNPGLLRTREGYLVVCRTVNYGRKPPRRVSQHADHMISTRNVIIRLTRDFKVLDERPLVIEEPPLRQSAVQGLEDCRPFEVRGSRFVLCATGDRHPSGYIHLSVCRLNPDGLVAAHRPLVGPFDDRHQKNWLPFVRRGTVRAIYGYDPFTVLRLDLDSGRYDVETAVANPCNAASWRGSAGPIMQPRSNRLLMLVHEVAVDQTRERRGLLYVHRFVECDSSFRVTRVSRPFVFVHRGIEFACGMTLSHDHRTLVIGLGIEDVSAYLCQISLERVEAMLQDV